MFNRTYLSNKFLTIDKHKITIKLIYGLKDIHDLDIIHYDIKLSNILVDNQTNVKYIDFGSSMDIKDMQKNQKYKEISNFFT